jgi:hypothetical protein
VRPFPGPGQPKVVSVGGGRSVAWNPRGHEIFCVADFKPNETDPNRVRYMMAVDFVETGGDIQFGEPRPLFDTLRTHLDGKVKETMWTLVPTRHYDVAPDGQSFLLLQTDPLPPVPPTTHINVIFNWTQELKAKVPRR